MELEKADILAALEEADINLEAARFNYSGRGMYGSTCFGIDGTDAEFARFLIALSHQGDDCYQTAMQLADCGKDSMGLGYIYYWRNLTVVD